MTQHLLLLLPPVLALLVLPVRVSSEKLPDEPLLRELFFATPAKLKSIGSSACLDSVFKLQRAYEAVYNFRAIYSDLLAGRDQMQLTQLEQKIMQFCHEPMPLNSTDQLRHPVNAHRFVAYVARSANPNLLEFAVKDNRAKQLLAQLISNSECWLNEASVADSMDSLLAVRAFYNVTFAEFAQSGNLTARKLMELLLRLNREFDPEQIAELAELLRRERMTEMLELGEQPVRSLFRMLGRAYYQMKQFDKAAGALRDFKTSPAFASFDSRGVDGDLAYMESNRRGSPKEFAEDSVRRVSQLERWFGHSRVDKRLRDGFQRYRGLCGDAVPAFTCAGNLSSSPLLVCENWRPHNGWYPIRKEILTVAPLVVRYLDVFTHWRNLTDTLMRETEKRLEEAPKEEFGPFEEHNRLTKVRLHSFTKPTVPFDSNVTRSIIGRIELVTQLDAAVHFKSLEKYIDVTNYGHGIQNQPHVTSTLSETFYDGMATALFFPEDDVIGGEVVFPETGLKIPVKRSDLVVWYNYLPTYLADSTAFLHYNCPVVYGDKWSARVTLGMLTCSLDQETMMEPWFPGGSLRRRRAVNRSWRSLPNPGILKKPAKLLGSNATASLETVANGTVGTNNSTASLEPGKQLDAVSAAEASEDALELADAEDKDEAEEEEAE